MLSLPMPAARPAGFGRTTLLYATIHALPSACSCGGTTVLRPHSLDSHFENDQVILNAPHPGINIPGAATGKNWHNHPLNRVMVYIHTGGEKLTYLDGSVADLKWQAGTVRWSPAEGYHYSELRPSSIRASGKPGIHHAMIVDIGIKKPGYPGK